MEQPRGCVDVGHDDGEADYLDHGASPKSGPGASIAAAHGTESWGERTSAPRRTVGSVTHAAEWNVIVTPLESVTVIRTTDLLLNRHRRRRLGW